MYLYVYIGKSELATTPALVRDGKLLGSAINHKICIIKYVESLSKSMV